MQIKKIFDKAAAIVLSAALLGLFGTAEYYSSRLPETIACESTNGLQIAQYPEISLSADNSDTAELSLGGILPVKKVRLSTAQPRTLIACGQPFGIKLLMEGVMVTALGEVEADCGTTVCPASEAGLKVGDIVCSADGQELTSNSQLQETIGKSGGKPLELAIKRGGDMFTATLKPVFSEVSQQWKGGMWVRDSIAGIGTMTFIDKDTGRFAGLGHPICDSDTGGIVPVHSGEAVPVEISGTKRGERGIPGELRGSFTSGQSCGSLDLNNKFGVFGMINKAQFDGISSEFKEFPLGLRHEVTTGAAEIYTTISGNKPQCYSIEIDSVDYDGDDSEKNMKIRITDERLLRETGGIIQGMSGSPIIQNGRLIGAVTHVFVADPSCGFGVFADSMAEFTK